LTTDIRAIPEFFLKLSSYPYENISTSSNYLDFSSFTQQFAKNADPVLTSINIQGLPSKFENLRNYILSLTTRNAQTVAKAL
jgi:hypothetical protein